MDAPGTSERGRLARVFIGMRHSRVNRKSHIENNKSGLIWFDLP
jgi:hypothetical protein